HFVLDGGSFCAPQFLILCFRVASSSLKFDAVEPKILHARVHYYIVVDRNWDFRGERGGCGQICFLMQTNQGDCQNKPMKM
ncbi:MAG: hypothetical protein J1E58_10285, partial [Prevotella sp.]|nr:hypothetical protein [Prevotella sp.]